MINEVMQKQVLDKTHLIKGSQSPVTSEMQAFNNCRRTQSYGKTTMGDSLKFL